MPPIITITTNTAIDWHLTVPHWDTADAALASHSVEYAGGKGVNVSKALASLGHASACLGFVGAQSQASFQALHSPMLTIALTPVPGRTRTNLTLFDPQATLETHIRTAGYTIPEQEIDAFWASLQQYIQADARVIISGSLALGLPDEFYQQVIAYCRAHQALVLFDSQGRGYRQALHAKPWLLKPNQAELEDFMGARLVDSAAVLQAAQQLIKAGITWVVVSQGADGVLAVNHARAWQVSAVALPAEIISQVGCGDVLLAGLALANLAQPATIAEGLAWAVACASANLFAPEPGRFNIDMAESLLPHIQVIQHPI